MDLLFSRNRLWEWKRRVSNFGINGQVENSAGDTYHFWHAVLAGITGISREEDTDSPPARIVKQIICDLTYPTLL